MKNFVLLLSFFLFVALSIVLPSCKAGEASVAQDYFLEVGKTFAKANLQVLFPEARFEEGVVQVSRAFEQARLRQVLRPRFRRFLTENGSIALDKADFQGTIKWARLQGDKVLISVFTKNKNPRDSL